METSESLDGFVVTKKRFIGEDQTGLLALWYTARVTSWLIGLAGVFMSLLMFVTIIGIPVALLMFNGSKGFFDYANGKRIITCPNCSKINYVKAEQTKFTCRKCKERVTIEWEQKQSEKPTAS